MGGKAKNNRSIEKDKLVDPITVSRDSLTKAYALESARPTLSALEWTLKKGKKEGLCIQKREPDHLSLVYEDGRWVITFSERGNDDRIADFDSPVKAAEKVIELMFPKGVGKQLAKWRFKRTLAKTDSTVSVVRLEELLKKSAGRAASL